MKYGVIVVTPVSTGQDRNFINIGDMVQTEAVLYLYKQMGIKQEDILRIDLKEINRYDGEYLVLPININLSLNWIIDILPLPPHIIPVFLGLSFFSASKFPQELTDYFRMYAPVGCRDEFTLRIMRQHNIPAYLYGCISAILPFCGEREGAEKIFYVDVPDSFEEFSKKNAKNISGEVVRVSHIRNEKEAADREYIEEITRNLLGRYLHEAKLVVTSRLHCMSPCMAMGIPIIPVTDNISPRMGWIDRYLHIYTPDTYADIQWGGQRVFYEDRKKQMVDIAAAKVTEAVEKYGGAADLSYFYETREKSRYGNYYMDVLKKLPDERKASLEYVLWGAGQIGMNAYQVIQKTFPDSTLKAVVDSYCSGVFFDVPVQKPAFLESLGKEYVFITTHSGELYAREMLEKLGKKEGTDFLSMSTTAG